MTSLGKRRRELYDMTASKCEARLDQMLSGLAEPLREPTKAKKATVVRAPVCASSSSASASSEAAPFPELRGTVSFITLSQDVRLAHAVGDPNWSSSCMNTQKRMDQILALAASPASFYGIHQRGRDIREEADECGKPVLRVVIDSGHEDRLCQIGRAAPFVEEHISEEEGSMRLADIHFYLDAHRVHVIERKRPQGELTSQSGKDQFKSERYRMSLAPMPKEQMTVIFEGGLSRPTGGAREHVDWETLNMYKNHIEQTGCRVRDSLHLLDTFNIVAGMVHTMLEKGNIYYESCIRRGAKRALVAQRIVESFEAEGRLDQMPQVHLYTISPFMNQDQHLLGEVLASDLVGWDGMRPSDLQKPIPYLIGSMSKVSGMGVAKAQAIQSELRLQSLAGLVHLFDRDADASEKRIAQVDFQKDANHNAKSRRVGPAVTCKMRTLIMGPHECKQTEKQEKVAAKKKAVKAPAATTSSSSSSTRGRRRRIRPVEENDDHGDDEDVA